MPNWRDPSGWVRVDETEITTPVLNVDFDPIFDASSKLWKITGAGITVDTDDAQFSIQMHIDGVLKGGTSYQITNKGNAEGGADVLDGSGGVNIIRFFGPGATLALGNAAGEALSVEIIIYDPASTVNFASLIGRCSFLNAVATPEHSDYIFSGTYTADTDPLTGIRFIADQNMDGGLIVIEKNVNF